MSTAVDDIALPLARAMAMTPSVSGEEEAAVRLVVQAMEEAGFDDVRVDDAGNAIGVVGPTTGPRLLIDGHIDSIPLHSHDRWTVDPFGGVVRSGRLYGLGICDQKASIAAAIHGVAAAGAAGSLRGPVAVVASVCEEAMEGQALASAVDWFGPDVVIRSEPNDTRLGIGLRGRAKLAVTVTGRACHAGHAKRASTPLRPSLPSSSQLDDWTTRYTPNSASGISRASIWPRGHFPRSRPCPVEPKPVSIALSSPGKPLSPSARYSWSAANGHGAVGPSHPASM